MTFWLFIALYHWSICDLKSSWLGSNLKFFLSNNTLKRALFEQKVYLKLWTRRDKLCPSVLSVFPLLEALKISTDSVLTVVESLSITAGQINLKMPKKEQFFDLLDILPLTCLWKRAEKGFTQYSFWFTGWLAQQIQQSCLC